MSEDKLDPDLKINMSLDQIIRLDKSLNQRFKKRKRRKRNLSVYDHSVPLLSSLGGGFIYVSKSSPLLNERKRRLMEAEQNRKLNSDLVRMTKKVIPASYHLVKTDTGFEKVLLPIRLNTAKWKKTKKKKGQPSKRNSDLMCRKEVNQSSTNNSDDEIVVLYSSIKSQVGEKSEPMDVENNSLSSNSVWSNVHCNNFGPQTPLNKTLSDQFRSVSTNYQPNAFANFQF